MKLVNLVIKGLIIAASFGLSLTLKSISKLCSFRKKYHKIEIYEERQVCFIGIAIGPIPFVENYTAIKFSHVDWL